MKSLFCVPFSDALPRLQDADGNDRLTSVSRVGQVPVAGVTTNVLLIEADEAAIAELKAQPDYLWLEDIDDKQAD